MSFLVVFEETQQKQIDSDQKFSITVFKDILNSKLSYSDRTIVIMNIILYTQINFKKNFIEVESLATSGYIRQSIQEWTN